MEKARQEVLITDFDGTLAWFSLPYSVHHWLSQHLSWLIPLIPVLPVVYALYLHRPCKRTAEQAILAHKREGGRVVVFSSTEDLWITRFIIWSCLVWWEIPCDQLILRPHGELTREFKMRVILEEGCSVLLENDMSMVIQFVDEVLKSGFRTISVARQQRYSMVSFQKGGDVA
jgi:hypothetical protein